MVRQGENLAFEGARGRCSISPVSAVPGDSQRPGGLERMEGVCLSRAWVGIWGVRAQGPDLEDCHTWECAFTEQVTSNLFLTKKLAAQRSKCSNSELLLFQFKVLHGALKDKTR